MRFNCVHWTDGTHPRFPVQGDKLSIGGDALTYQGPPKPPSISVVKNDRHKFSKRLNGV
jgi:hypothetical protein